MPLARGSLIVQSYDITVTLSAGAYVTRTVAGLRASCTMSAEQAATRLGEKLFPETLVKVEQLGQQGTDGVRTTRWRLTASTEG